MKIKFIASSALIATLMFSAVSAQAAAELTFLSFGGGNPVVFDVGGALVGATFKGQVYAGTSSGSLTAIGSAAPFATPFGGSEVGGFEGFIIDGSTLTLPSVNPGAGFYQLKVWNAAAGSSFEVASAVVGAHVGSSAITSITFGGSPLAGGTGTPGPNIDNFTSFTLSTVAAVPEPATLALGLFGAAGLLFRRRK